VKFQEMLIVFLFWKLTLSVRTSGTTQDNPLATLNLNRHLNIRTNPW